MWQQREESSEPRIARLIVRRWHGIDERVVLRELDAQSLIAVEIEPAYNPDPTAPDVGESFTIPVDGSAQTVSLAISHSGQHAAFALAAAVDPLTYSAEAFRPLRPGLDDAGGRTLYEILTSVTILDDGAGTSSVVRVVPVDRLGNIADIASPHAVTVSTQGVVRIIEPDVDGDPYHEVVTVSDARGFAISLDDSGTAFDDVNADLLMLESAGAPFVLRVSLPDPDIAN